MSFTSSVDLAGRRVLVVEDEFLIAMDMEAMLRTLGADIVEFAMSVDGALAAIDRASPELALLDLKLKSDTTAPIAEALHARAIPFVFVTGYADLGAMPAPLRATPLIRKPVDLATLATVLGSLKL